MGGLREAVEHGEHVDGCEDGEDVGIAVSGEVGETAPEGAEGCADGSGEEILECAADAGMHHCPDGDDGPPAFVGVPPVAALGKPGWD